jgi:hypothetical protein
MWVEGLDCRLIGAAPGKQVAIAGLGIEKPEDFAELQISIQLRVGRSVAVDGARLERRGLDLMRDVGNAAERDLGKIDAHAHIGDRIVEAAERCNMRA